jgi:hypothetical protein
VVKEVRHGLASGCGRVKRAEDPSTCSPKIEHTLWQSTFNGGKDAAPATLVFFITRDGHSRELASRIGERLNAPVHEIQDLVSRDHLRGARIALLASCQISPPARIQAPFDSELGKAFGPLAALAVVHQNLSEPEKSRIINDFAAALRNA